MNHEQFEKADTCLRKRYRLRKQLAELETATKNVMKTLETPAEQRVWDDCGYGTGKMLRVCVLGSYYLPISDAELLRLLEEEKRRMEAEMEKQEKIFESI